MKVYLPEAREIAQRNLFVTPGNSPDAKNVSEWFRDDGSAIMLTVEFKFGVAKVPGNLGRYLVDNQLAAQSPIILN